MTRCGMLPSALLFDLACWKTRLHQMQIKTGAQVARLYLLVVHPAKNLPASDTEHIIKLCI